MPFHTILVLILYPFNLSYSVEQLSVDVFINTQPMRVSLQAETRSKVTPVARMKNQGALHMQSYVLSV